MSGLDDALRVLASVRLPDGRRWGDAAVDVQWSDARAVLDDTSPVRRHFILRSRGYSKTFDAAAMTAAVMLTQAPRSARLYTAAADRDQARIIVDAFTQIVTSTEELTPAFAIDSWKVSVPRTDVVFEVLSSDAASAFGRTPWWLVIDEVCQHPATSEAQRFYEALSTALPKRADSRALLISTPGDPTHWSHRVYESALAEPELWRASETRGPAPWIEPRLVRAEKRRLPDSSFRRWWLGEWTASEDSAFGGDDVLAAATLDGPLDPRPNASYVVTVDLGWRVDNTAICVAHREAVGDTSRVVVDRLEVIRPRRHRELNIERIEDRVAELAERYHWAHVICDPRELVSSMQRLRGRGLRVTEHVFSVSSNTKLALRLLELVRARRLAVPADDDLVEELLGIRITERGPGLFKVEATGSDGHGDRTVAIGMAALALDTTPLDTEALSSVEELTTARITDGPGSSGMEWTSAEALPTGTVMAELHRRIGGA